MSGEEIIKSAEARLQAVAHVKARCTKSYSSKLVSTITWMCG